MNAVPLGRLAHFAIMSVACLAFAFSARAATFPSGPTDNARIEITDSSGLLSWNPSSISPAPNALTVSCWVKISIPSGVSLSKDMTMLANRRTGDWSQPHAYRFYFNIQTGAIEFSARGTNGPLSPMRLVERPYLDRWYHLAVVRSGDVFTLFVDGRQLSTSTQSIGSTSTTDGVSIGGFRDQERFWGEMQEVAIYQQALSRSVIVANMLQDVVPANFPELRGYFKLGFSTNVPDRLKNFAASPPSGTETAQALGTGTIEFPETDKNGEQSVFDARKNDGRDALASLAGNFMWGQALFSRPTPGVPFELSFGYSSSNAFSGQPVEGGINVMAEDSVLSSGWRHSFQARLISADQFLPGAGATAYVGMLTWEGSLETWKRETRTRHVPTHGEYRGELREDDTGDFMEWITPGRLIYKFHHPSNAPNALLRGRLAEIRDFNAISNKVVLNYQAATGRLTSVIDSGGGVWLFNYNAQNLLREITGPADDPAKKWTVTFTYDGQNRLISKSLAGPAAHTAVSSTTWQFAYMGSPQSLLETITNPRGVREIHVNYDTYGRKVFVRDVFNRSTTFDYNKPASRQLTTTAVHRSDVAENRVTVDTFDRKLRLVSSKSPLGHVMTHEYDAAGNVIATTDPRGARTTMTYDPRANVLTRTNVLGETIRWEYAGVLPGGVLLNKPTKEIRPATTEAPTGWENRYTYDGAGNLLTHRDGPVGGAEFGTLATHAYDARGLVTWSKDANGNDTRFAYEAATGFLASKTIAHGTPQAATWTYTRSELGWLLTETNPLSHATTTRYNVNGQPDRIVDPIRTFAKDYDAKGNPIAESDGEGRSTTYIYNEADERRQTTDRAGKSWDYGYSFPGELIATTAPEAVSDGIARREIVRRVYDLNGRLIRDVDPYGSGEVTPSAGTFVSYEYDPNGNQTAMIDKLGRRWGKTYDALNRVIAERDPEGNVRQTRFDAAGRIKTLISANGHVSSHDYDGRGRLVTWTDPEGFVWRYTYDGVGNILRITDALGGNYDMTYGPRNERLTEKNQDGQTWTYTYDLLARLKEQTDPNGTKRTLDYDPVSRLKEVAFNTGRFNALTYDRNNNLKTLSRTKPGSQSTTLTLAYDEVDRLKQSQDTFSNIVDYSYDALGRVVTKQYPGGRVLTHSYDRLGRLKGLNFTAVSGGPALASAFTYDSAGRLRSRSYPNGIVQENDFDSTGRLKSLSYKQGSTALIALTYAYDRNGNKTGGTESGTLSWTPASMPDYDDTSEFSKAGKLEKRTDAAPATPKVFTYEYDASGNMKRALSGAESYTLDYDEDNRTTSIAYATGTSTTTIQNRYDALGRRVARTLNNSETRYVLDLLGDMERILCETDINGAIAAWFVHGPDLSFKVAANGDMTCYHADGVGNIIRTTGAGGTAVNQYAYTPYGRRIAANGPQTNALAAQPYTFVGSQGVMEELPGLYFMRARYYSADASVFLSIDPVKRIGPGLMQHAFIYANSNPLSFVDSDGRVPKALKPLVDKAKNLGVKIATEIAKLSGAGTKNSGKEMTSAASGAALKAGSQPPSKDIGPNSGTTAKQSSNAVMTILNMKGTSGDSPVDHVVKHARDKVATWASEQMIKTAALTNQSLKGLSNASQYAETLSRGFGKVVRVGEIIKGSYDQISSRGYGVSDITGGWRNLPGNIKYGVSHVDDGIGAMYDGVTSATAFTINNITFGWTNLSGPQLETGVDWYVDTVNSLNPFYDE